jgi:tRNA pseudouridine38-40 synthase
VNPTSRFFIELSYKGTRYHGWQVQPNAVTVQEVLEKALSIVLREKTETTGCGRTDSGVHASAFFAHFSGSEALARSLQNEEARLTATARLNAILPQDIAIKRIFPVHGNAHARFDASERSYRYFIHFHKDPFSTETSWLLPKKPDITRMNEAAALLTDYVDFSSFSKSHTQVLTNNCTIRQAVWSATGKGIVFQISANRFLRNMVRAIVGTLLDVGYGKIQPAAVGAIIESRSRSHAGASVPACGLHLTEIIYPYLNPPKPPAEHV